MRVKVKFKMKLLTPVEKDNICDSMKEEGHTISFLRHINMTLEVKEL